MREISYSAVNRDVLRPLLTPTAGYLALLGASLTMLAWAPLGACAGAAAGETKASRRRRLEATTATTARVRAVPAAIFMHPE